MSDRYTVTMTLGPSAGTPWVAGEFSLFVPIVRAIKAAKACGLREAKTAAEEIGGRDAKDYARLTFIVRESGLGRLYYLSRHEGQTSYEISNVEHLGSAHIVFEE